MKKLIVTIETNWSGIGENVEVEIEGDETQEELEEIARDEFHNYCSYGWHVVDGDEDEEE